MVDMPLNSPNEIRYIKYMFKVNLALNNLQ